MSDKKLLNESTVRRFMKLAQIGGLSDRFITENDDTVTEEEQIEEMGMAYNRDDEEEEVTEESKDSLEEELDLEDEEAPPSVDPDAAEPPPEADEEPMPDMELDADMGAGEADMSLSEEEAQILIDLGARLSDAIGPEDEAEVEPEDAPDLDGAPDLDAAPVDDEEDLGAVMAEGINRQALVAEILKRVTKRIVKEKIQK